jgi:hypothetical protein
MLIIVFRRNKQLIQELSIPPQDSKDIYFDTQYTQTMLAQCKACLWKQHLSYWRNTSYTAVRLLFTTLIAILFGIIFWNIGLKRYVTQKVNKTLYIVITNAMRKNEIQNNCITGERNKIFSMQWDQCMLLLSLLEYKMVLLCNL